MNLFPIPAERRPAAYLMQPRAWGSVSSARPVLPLGVSVCRCVHARNGMREVTACLYPKGISQ